MLIFQLKYNVYSCIDYKAYFTCYIKFFLIKTETKTVRIILFGVLFF